MIAYLSGDWLMQLNQQRFYCYYCSFGSFCFWLCQCDKIIEMYLFPSSSSSSTPYSGGEEYSTSGGRFMADLLVTSLIADGGLEAALEASLLGIAIVITTTTITITATNNSFHYYRCYYHYHHSYHYHYYLNYCNNTTATTMAAAAAAAAAAATIHAATSFTSYLFLLFTRMYEYSQDFQGLFRGIPWDSVRFQLLVSSRIARDSCFWLVVFCVLWVVF